MSDQDQPLSVEEARPMVAREVTNRGAWIFGIILAVVAVAMFAALEARRSLQNDPTALNRSGSGDGMISAPPELTIPRDYDDQAIVQFPPAGTYPGGFFLPAAPGPQDFAPQEPIALRPLAPRNPSFTQSQPQQQWTQPPADFRPVIQRPQSSSFSQPPEPQPVEAQNGFSRVANPSTTLMKGTVIHAVLETALDSNRAGAARAVVSRNVMSYDGSQVLVPKGSKLLGEYESDIARGQNRALIHWSRLLLPDGVIVDVDSPSADPLGRAGVKGKVNSHFFERFGGAILKSFLDIGLQVATREVAGGTVVVALPGSTQQLGPQGEDIRPTLKIRHGTSVAVFVGRDLDFAGVMP